jgi:hypothetical protein
VDIKTRVHAGIIRRKLLARNNYPTFVAILEQMTDKELIEQERLHHENTMNRHVLQQLEIS